MSDGFNDDLRKRYSRESIEWGLARESYNDEGVARAANLRLHLSKYQSAPAERKPRNNYFSNTHQFDFNPNSPLNRVFIETIKEGHARRFGVVAGTVVNHCWACRLIAEYDALKKLDEEDGI